MIAYLAERYPSMQRAASDYASMVGPLTDRVDEARAVIFHGSMNVLPEAIEAYTKRQPWIGYLVWEAEQLPERAKPMLDRFDEVWTASTYCARVLRQHHGNVHVIPHVAEPPPYTQADVMNITRRLDRADDEVIVLAVANWNDPRKNLQQLLRAYARVQLPGLRLVVKTMSMEPIGRSKVLWWNEAMAPSTLTALIDACDAMISVHHGEGWGLNLSDAMALGKVTCATGYSGNLEFMHENNSILLPYVLGPVERAPYPFTQDMTWAHLRDQDIEEGFLRIHDAVRKQTGLPTDMQRFSKNVVKTLVSERVKIICP